MTEFPFEIVDLVIVGLILLSALGGWRLGLIAGVVDGVGLIAAVGLASRFSSQVSTLAGDFLLAPLGVLRPIVTIGIIAIGFIVAGLIGRIIAGVVRLVIPPDSFVGAVSSLAGGVLGGSKGAVLLGFALIAVTPLLPQDSAIYRQINHGQLVDTVTSLSRQVEPFIRESIDPIFSGQAQVNPIPDGAQTSRLPIPWPSQLAVSPDAENKMLDLINEERRLSGLPPLAMSPLAQEVARAHSEEMFRLRYFSYSSRDGKTPPERLRQAGINFTIAAENVAFAPSVVSAHRGLLDSPSHRRNLLSKDFRRVGIGIVDGGIWGIMVTQDFTD